MCRMLYLAVDVPAPEIGWSEVTPRFHVRRIAADEDVVRQHFTKDLVYRVGSSEGCGCRFSIAPDDESFDEEERLLAQAARRELHAYVAEMAAGGVTRVELYCRWSGEQELPAEHRIAASSSRIIESHHWFAEGVLVTLST